MVLPRLCFLSILNSQHETLSTRLRHHLRRAWHDRYLCAWIAYNAFCVVSILVFLPFILSFADMVVAIIFGQIHPRVPGQGWSHYAQARVHYRIDGYDGGYLYYFLYLLSPRSHYCLVCWSYRLPRRRLHRTPSKRLTLTYHFAQLLIQSYNMTYNVVGVEVGE